MNNEKENKKSICKYFEKLSKKKILEAIKMRDDIVPFKTNDVEDIMREIEEFGASYVANHHCISEEILLSYPYFKKYQKRWMKKQKNPKVGQQATESQKQKPVFDIF